MRTDAMTIINGLGGSERSRKCRCPAHDDRTASLHVSESSTGKVLLYCHAGCTQQDVIEALRRKGLWGGKDESMAGRMNDELREPGDEPEDDGKAEIVREVLDTAGAFKDDHQNKVDEMLDRYLSGRGIDKVPVPHGAMWLGANEVIRLGKRFAELGWKWKFPAIVLPILTVSQGSQRIPAGTIIAQGLIATFLTRDSEKNLRDDDGKSIRRTYGRLKGGFVQLTAWPDGDDYDVVIAEGIETALSAVELIDPKGRDLLGLAVPGGNYASIVPPHGRRLIIAADNDKSGAGWDKAETAAKLWAARGRAVEIAMPRDHNDWNDAVRDRNVSLADLRDDLLHGELIEPDAQQASALSVEDFMNVAFPPVEYLLEPWLCVGDLAMIHAYRGNHKTWMALSMAHAIATGKELLGWKVRKTARVLYVDGEMTGTRLQGRLKAFGGCPPNMLVLSSHYLHLIGKTMPDLATEEGRDFLDRIIEEHGIEVIILDHISALVRSGVENDAESWAPLAPWQLKHRYRNHSIIYIHHEGRSGNPRGTSKREDAFDAMIKLQSRPEQAGDEESASQLSFTKTREFFGADTAPKMIYLSTQDGRVQWRHESVEANKREQVIELLRDGTKKATVAKQLGVTPSYVSRIARQEADTIRRPRDLLS